MPRATTIGVFCVLWAITGTTYAEEEFATYYTTKSCQKEGNSGIWTASGRKFNENAMECALRHHNFGDTYRVINLETGTSVVVVHTDYGPNRTCAKRGVIVDLTPAAFAKLAPLKRGKIKVAITHVNNDK